ncbi:hypothetical protein VTP01DRAFT_390 [Rhizomucor pusillus]|uniref:uncharacterized protein n=1 Tax=Rhizomucor pusillus TaxID=4840 RepID=UPI0037431B76
MEGKSCGRVKKLCQQSRRTDRLRQMLRTTPAETTLLEACRKKSAKEVEALLAAFPSINPDTIRDSHLRTPLHIACAREDDLTEATAIAKVLIRAGSDVNNGVGDVDGFQPMHMAVLAGNIQCVLLLLEKGASIPASDPFRLTPLLLAKFKMDNLRPSRMVKDNRIPVDISYEEYRDLQSITEVLVKHLANKHSTMYGTSKELQTHGLSDILFAKEDPDPDVEVNQAIQNVTEQLSRICVNEESGQLVEDTIKNLMEKTRNLSLRESVDYSSR